MNEKEIKLPSGSTLKIMSVPFSVAKTLYQSVLEEAKSIGFDSKTDVSSVLKNLLCYGFSSKKVEAALDECLKRCLYNGTKIDANTFEPDSARQDYMKVCLEVAQEILNPFMKGLYAELLHLLEMIPSDPK